MPTADSQNTGGMFRNKKVKQSHIRLTSVGLGADPLGSHPAGNIVINPVLGCRYFPIGLQLPSQPKSITAPWPVSNYTAW